MKIKFTLTALLFALMITNSTSVHANDTQTSITACGDSDFVSDVVISYTEGNDYLTAMVQVENFDGESKSATARIFNAPPDKDGAIDSASVADNTEVNIPLNGLGTYRVRAEVNIEGCSTAITVENSITLMDEATFFANKIFLPRISSSNTQEIAVTASNLKSMNTCDAAVINGDNSNNILIGSNENADIIEGKNGDDTITGNGCDDILRGGRGKDTLMGGDGNDVLDGGKGFWWPKDTCIGGPGTDSFTECEIAVQ